MTKRTYLLPDDVLAEFEAQIPAGKRGSAVAAALREWLDEKRREKLRAEIEEGLREMAEIYLETEREFHALEEEVDRKLHADERTLTPVA